MNLRLKFKKDKKNKFSKFSVWHYFLIITISTLLFVGIILFFYQYILGVSETNSSDVLQLSVRSTGSVNKIDRYEIEYLDTTTGNRKSIRPKDCFTFDDKGYGATSFMKRICRRNFFAMDNFVDSVFNRNNAFGYTAKPGIQIDTGLRDPSKSVNDRILPPSLDPSTAPLGNFNPGSSYARDTSSPFVFGYVDLDAARRGVLRKFGISGYSNNVQFDGTNKENYRGISRLISSPLPNILTNPSGEFYFWSEYPQQSIKDMFIFDEVKPDYERNSVLTKAYIVSVGNVPVMIYYGGLYSIDTKGRRAKLLTRLWNSDSYYTKTCSEVINPNEVYTMNHGELVSIFWRNKIESNYSICSTIPINRASVGGKYSGEACFDEGLRLSMPEMFSTLTRSNKVWNPAYDCKTYDGNNATYQSNVLHQVVLRNNNGNVSLETKRGYSSELFLGPNGGFAHPERISCIGISKNFNCKEIVESSVSSKLYARRITKPAVVPPYDYVACNSAAGSGCDYPIIENSSGYSNLSGGYELPQKWYDEYGIRSFDLPRNRLFSDVYGKNRLPDFTVIQGSVPDNSAIDFSFSTESNLYAIDLRQNNYILYQFDLIKSGSNYQMRVTSQPSSGTITPLSLLRRENISTTYSEITSGVSRVSIMFSDKLEQRTRDYNLQEFFVYESTTYNPQTSLSGANPVRLGSGGTPPQPILAIEIYPVQENDGTYDNYIYVTRENVYFSRLNTALPPPPPPPCSVSVNASAIITNTSPNSSLNLTWPLSYPETQNAKLVMSVRNSNNTPVTCNNQPITSAEITINNPVIPFTSINGTVVANPTDSTLIFQAPSNLRPFASNMNYNIARLSLTFGTGTPPVVLTPTTHPNLFGTRGWDFYTENITRMSVQNPPTPLLNVNFTKYKDGTALPIFQRDLVVNPVFDIVSPNIPGFFYDSEYPPSPNSQDNFWYQVCFAAGTNILSAAPNNTSMIVSILSNCVRYRHLSTSQGTSPITLTITLAPPVCQIPLNAVATISNSSVSNSNLSNTWPISYSETLARRLNITVGNPNNSPFICSNQRITSATLSLRRSIDGALTTYVASNVGQTTTNNQLQFTNLPNTPNMNYDIVSLSLTFGLGTTSTVVTLTPASNPNLFGTRGWDFYTENIVNLRVQNSPTTQLNVSVEKYRVGQTGPIFNSPNLSINPNFNIVSSNIPGFFFDSDYPASTNSVDNYSYVVCFEPGSDVSSFTSSNTNLQVARFPTSTSTRCLRLTHTSNSRGVSPIILNVTLSNTDSDGLNACEVNGNLYVDNAGGTKMFPKPSNLKPQEGILFSNNSFSNSWSRYVTNTKLFPDFFQNSQTTLQGFIASSSLNFAASGSEFYLLTNPSSPTEGSGSAFPSGNYVTLDNPNSSTKDFHILAVSRGRGLRIDLTNSFLQNQKIDNFAFVNMTKNLRERVRFFADCSNSNYSNICGNGFKYIVKAPFYGSVLFEFRNASSSSLCRNIIFTENPDILMNLIPTIRSKKLNFVTSTPINVTYLD